MTTYRVKLYFDVDADSEEAALYEAETAVYDSNLEFSFLSVENLDEYVPTEDSCS